MAPNVVYARTELRAHICYTQRTIHITQIHPKRFISSNSLPCCVLSHTLTNPLSGHKRIAYTREYIAFSPFVCMLLFSYTHIFPVCSCAQAHTERVPLLRLRLECYDIHWYCVLCRTKLCVHMFGRVGFSVVNVVRFIFAITFHSGVFSTGFFSCDKVICFRFVCSDCRCI